MDKIIEQLDALVLKTAKGAGNSQAQEAASLLLRLYKESRDKKKTAQYICTMHFSICQLFFEKAVSELENGQIQSICAAIRSNEEYKKNASYKGTVRGYTAAAVLIANKNPLGKVLLMDTVSDTEKNGELPPKAVDLFNKHVIRYCKAKTLYELGESSWNNNDRREKYRSILEMALSPAISPAANDNADPGSKDAVPTENAMSDGAAEKQNAPNDSAQDSGVPAVQAADLTARDNMSALAAREAETLLDTVRKANNELQTLLRTIVNTNETPSYLRRQITELEDQLAEARKQISERDRKLVLLKLELGNRDNTISQLQADNDDLTERLTKTLQLDASANNQELITMRTDISNALKLEYQDYQDSRGKEQSEDQFEAYRASLFRIFKTLKRFNIALD